MAAFSLVFTKNTLYKEPGTQSVYLKNDVSYVNTIAKGPEVVAPVEKGDCVWAKHNKQECIDDGPEELTEVEQPLIRLADMSHCILGDMCLKPTPHFQLL
jgi:hypothetical protein